MKKVKTDETLQPCCKTLNNRKNFVKTQTATIFLRIYAQFLQTFLEWKENRFSHV